MPATIEPVKDASLGQVPESTPSSICSVASLCATVLAASSIDWAAADIWPSATSIKTVPTPAMLRLLHIALTSNSPVSPPCIRNAQSSQAPLPVPVRRRNAALYNSDCLFNSILLICRVNCASQIFPHFALYSAKKGENPAKKPVKFERKDLTAQRRKPCLDGRAQKGIVRYTPNYLGLHPVLASVSMGDDAPSSL